LKRQDNQFLTVDAVSGKRTEIYQIPEGQDLDNWEITQDNDWIYFLDQQTVSDVWMLEYADR